MFINASECKKSIELMDNYIEEVENIQITGLDLKSEYDNVKTSTCRDKKNIKSLIITCQKDELLAKELYFIIETLEQCLDLPAASIMVKKIIQNCVILECRILSAVEVHLLQLEITASKLETLSDLKISSLVLNDGKELQIPIHCSAKVIPVSIKISAIVISYESKCSITKLVTTYVYCMYAYLANAQCYHLVIPAKLRKCFGHSYLSLNDVAP